MFSTKNSRFVRSLLVSVTLVSLTVAGFLFPAGIGVANAQSRREADSAARKPRDPNAVTRTPITLEPVVQSASPDACANVIVDGGFETGGIPSTFWNPETSTNFGTPLCDSASCGTAGGTSPPRTGLIWAWFGGIPALETATLGQTVNIASGSTATLNFWIRVGTVSSPFTDVLNVRVDGAIVQSYPEPTVAEGSYTLRTLNLNAFANGANHAILFEYIGPSSGTGSYVVDDVTLDVCSAVTPPSTDSPVDMDGSGTTDYVVVRNLNGPADPNGQIRWFGLSNPPTLRTETNWGIGSDHFIPADYDGDFKDDIAIWRPGTDATFWILQSGTQTVRIENFGHTGDDPSVVADYNNDNRDDIAVYRDGINPGDQSRWYYRVAPAPGGPFTVVDWGRSGDLPVPGDYDADNRADFVVQRNDGGQSRFFTYLATTQMDATGFIFGNNTDVLVPGDYDGDDKTDIAVSRLSGGNWIWYIRPSTGGATITHPWGVDGDIHTQGDYDGSGTIDIAIWRPGSQSAFWIRFSVTNGLATQNWGAIDDYPVAAYNSR